MILHRIGGNRHINDLSGKGAAINGGRWNRVGVPVLYASPSIALSAWEYFVHLPEEIRLVENAFSRISIEVPDDSVLDLINRIYPDDFRQSEEGQGPWPQMTGNLISAFEQRKEGEDLWAFTDSWIRDGKYLCMKVPSVVIPGEFNYLINPKHPLATPDSCRIIETVPFSFDNRGFNRKLQ